METELLRLTAGPIHVLGQDPFFHTDPQDMGRGLNWDGVILYRLRQELIEDKYGSMPRRSEEPGQPAAMASPEKSTDLAVEPPEDDDHMDAKSSKSKPNLDSESIIDETESELGDLLPPNLGIDESSSELDYAESEVSQNQENELLKDADAKSDISNTTTIPMDESKNINETEEEKIDE
jgi:hypothetical protein